MRRIGLSAYRKLYFIPLIVLILLGMVVNGITPDSRGEGVAGLVGGLTAIWFVAGRWIAKWCVPMAVSTLTCPGCHEELDAVGVWNCGCGYHDHRERHILSTAACPLCEGHVGHVNCPRCDATILLW